ncbi:MAG TPA: DNA repair protein RadA [Anaerolineales bacterium]|nr:DNA repair protein RadA [Anaerolineales bacterium]
MSKPRIEYECSNCGRKFARQMGRCPQCGEWGTLQEVVEAAVLVNSPRRGGTPTANVPRRLSEVESDPEPRFLLPIEEFSRVLGGGIVPGSVVLIGGDPGIGKSTLLLQIAASMAETAGSVLYISGEESARQIKMRAERLYGEKPFPSGLLLLTETNLENILEHLQSAQARLAIVDSIQTTFSTEVNSTAGSVSQVRECAARLTTFAKTSGMALFLIGHVTKEGTLAGPRVLEHMVDTVLYLEGDRHHSYRLLRGVKNRFGATNEVGVFEMHGHGMVEVRNPSEAFLAERMVNTAGSAIAVTMEGTRPLLVEVQALASPTTFGNPRRTPNGVDMNRLLLLTAVLTRRVGLRLHEQDVFVNVVGGMTVEEPAADLAIAIAIASSVRDVAVPADMAMIGEVGLSGELRAVGQLNARLKEAAKLGFRKAIVPKSLRPNQPYPSGIQVLEARSLREALGIALKSEEKPA